MPASLCVIAIVAISSGGWWALEGKGGYVYQRGGESVVTGLQKRKLARQKKQEKMRKHTSSLTHPTRCLAVVPEVAMRNSGQQQTRKCEKWCDSEVAIKKHWWNTAESIDNKGQSESDPPFRKWCRDSKLPVCAKKPEQPEA
jgi:hypothetical protein